MLTYLMLEVLIKPATIKIIYYRLGQSFKDIYFSSIKCFSRLPMHLYEFYLILFKPPYKFTYTVRFCLYILRQNILL